MPDIIGMILWPLRWIIEFIMVAFHGFFTAIGLPTEAGVTWVLSIVGLVMVVRAALIPIFVKQIKSSRRMLEVAPQLKKIQDKYRGKKDQFSREAMSRETMALYKTAGTNPFSSCLPVLIQMPIFFALFTVLNDAQQKKSGIGVFSLELSNSFGSSEIFGAPLHGTFINSLNAGGPWQVEFLAVLMIVLMTASQFITQLQMVSKNMTAEVKASPTFKQQRVLLYLMPLVFAFSGFTFPIGVMTYWLVTNIWTMVQQFIVIRHMPTPGTQAAKARDERLARKGKLPEQNTSTPNPLITGKEAAVEKKPTQRQQPISKSRAKKKPKTS